MGRVIVVQYITLDGVVEDPDGSDGTTAGGWAMRYGPEGIAGDKFRLSGISETVIAQLRDANLIDEYRLITFPVVLGEGKTLFPGAAHLELVSSEVVGPGSLSTYRAK